MEDGARRALAHALVLLEQEPKSPAEWVRFIEVVDHAADCARVCLRAAQREAMAKETVIP
jgi:hypothetical protein